MSPVLKPDRVYRAKISGPLMDRMDIQIEVPRLSYDELTRPAGEEPSAAIRERVTAALKIQEKRFCKILHCHNNAGMGPELISKYCGLEPDCEATLRRAVDRPTLLPLTSYVEMRGLANLICCVPVILQNVKDGVY